MKTIETGSVEGTEGEWVLMVGGKVVASSEDPEWIFNEAMKYPDAETLVTKILSAGASFY